MAAPEDRRGRRGRAGPTGSASERAYRALLRAYPEDLRGEYGEEMARAFRDLRRRELERRGARGLALLWARALPELVFTALKERSVMLARNAYLPVPPRIAARWGTLSALLGGVLGMGLYAVVAAFPVVRWYEESPALALLAVLSFNAAALLSVLGAFGLYGTLVARSGRPGFLPVAGAAFAVLAAVSMLAAGGYEAARGLAGALARGPEGAFLSSAWWLGWWPRLFGDLGLAGRACWFLGLLLLGAGAFRARLFGPLRGLPLAVAALLPASLILSLLLARIGYFPTLLGCLPFLGTALLGLALLRGREAAVAIAPSGATSAAPTRRPLVGRRTARSSMSATEAAKEKELLGALRRHGELAVAGAALETSLTVEEADRMLSALATKGHLEVRVERGRLLYSLWEGDDPSV